MKITAIVPWLVKVESSYWGEYLFVEVRTDEGLSGWGEITTTTKIANRAVAGMLHQLNELLVGDDPRKIERLWHKTFRAFTYMGSRGAASHVVSGVDIALWDILGKSRGLPIYEMMGGPVRDDILIYTHPDQSKFTSREGVVEEIRTILDSGHDAIKLDPFPGYEGQAGHHEVKLMPPAYVKAYVKRNKNDAAICEAVTRPSMRFVPVKNVDQQAVLMMHRARNLLVRQRTMAVNALRAHLAEFGVVAPQGLRHVEHLVVAIEENKAGLPELARSILRLIVAQLDDTKAKIRRIEARLAQWHRSNRVSKLLATVPGVGIMGRARSQPPSAIRACSGLGESSRPGSA